MYRKINKSFEFSGIIIYPVNSLGSGWKIKNASVECSNKSGQIFIECIEDHAYSTKDIILNADAANSQFASTSIYWDYLSGIVQFLNVGEQMLSNSPVSESTLKQCLHDPQSCELDNRSIKLNPNMSYFIFMVDRKLQSFTEAPGEISRTVLTLNPSSGYVRIFLKVSTKFVIILAPHIFTHCSLHVS